MTVLVQVCLALTALLLGVFAWLFAVNPAAGFRQTTHRAEQLPYVMSDRYAALTLIALGLVFFGSLPMVAVFFIACAIMGFGDAWIYARAGHSHIKHTGAGIAATVALVITLIAITTGDAA